MEAYTYSKALTQRERTEAVALITLVFKRAGYISDETEQSSLSTRVLRGEAATFLAKKGDLLCGTLSVFDDGPLGVPLEDIFAPEISELRNAGKKLAEVGQFAVYDPRNDVTMPVGINPALGLFKLVFAYAKANKIDTLCITVNPKHERFYHAMGFVRWERECSYAAVNGHPAVGMTLDLHIAEKGPVGLLRKLLF